MLLTITAVIKCTQSSWNDLSGFQFAVRDILPYFTLSSTAIIPQAKAFVKLFENCKVGQLQQTQACGNLNVLLQRMNRVTKWHKISEIDRTKSYWNVRKTNIIRNQPSEGWPSGEDDKNAHQGRSSLLPYVSWPPSLWSPLALLLPSFCSTPDSVSSPCDPGWPGRTCWQLLRPCPAYWSEKAHRGSAHPLWL